MIGAEIAFTGPDGVPCVGVVYIVGKGRRSGGFVAKVTKSEAPRLIGKCVSFDTSEILEGGAA